MKIQIKSKLKYIAALVLCASALFLCCAFAVRLPRGVYVNGCDVGGMTYAAAKSRLRRAVEEDLKTKRLRICADERVYEYTFPEIDYSDGFDFTLTQIKRGGSYFSPVHYFLNGAEEIAEYICSGGDRATQEPYATFSAEGEPFEYFDGADGVLCDRKKLLEDISRSLNGAFEEVSVCATVIPRKGTVEEVKERTRKLYSFTTYFDGDNLDRSENIRLAAQKINGSVVESGEIFSFNSTVGARTESNGFKQAKIIEDGKFVLGYGGGVCQASTTLYNAAILSGLEVVEYHPHSLQVNYVAPSRDAMVSGTYFDLKFKNNRDCPVYLRASATANSVTCTVYGKSDGYDYSFLSTVSEVIPRPQAVVVKGEEQKVISYGRDGTVSEGYLVKTKNGEEECVLVRKDKYLAVADVVQETEGE